MPRIDYLHLVGLGGTGGALCAPLTRLLRHHPNNNGWGTKIVLQDGDRHEEENDARQPGETGLNKAAFHAASLGGDFQSVEVRKTYFNLEDAQHLLQEPGNVLLVLAVDNYLTRRVALEALAGRRSQMLVLLPGNDLKDGNCLAWEPGRRFHDDRCEEDFCVCTKTSPLDYSKAIRVAADEIPVDEPGCERRAEAGEPQTIAANFTAAALCLWAATNYLDDLPVQPKLSFDFRRGEVQRA